MSTLVIYCHPAPQSFNRAVLRAVLDRLEVAGEPHELIDLYADGFDPALSASELAGYGEGLVRDPLVTRYQQMLGRADRLELVFPIWWNDAPAMLRGFVDKVMLSGFSWHPTGSGLAGDLGFIRSADLWTTSAEPTEHLELAVRSSFIEGTLAQLGIGAAPAAFDGAVPAACPTRRWHNFGLIDPSTPAQRAAWLEEIRSFQE